MKAFKLLALLAVGALLYWGAQSVLSSRSLRLTKFEVNGNTEARVSTDTIIGATDIRLGDQLLAVSTENISGRLEKLPWVARAKVERILPSTLRITIDEREASLVLQTGDGPFLLDAGGLVLQQGSEELIELAEMPLGRVTPGATISTPEFDHVAKILRSLPPSIRSTVSSVKAPSIDQIQIETFSGRIIYYGAAEQLEDKNYAAETLLERTKDQGPEVRVIDVRVPTRPVTRAH